MQPQLQPEFAKPRRTTAFSAFTKIFYAPGEAYEDAGPKSWHLPLLSACILVVVMNAVVINRIGLGTIVRNQLESSTALAERLGPEGIDKAVQQAESSTFQNVMAHAGAPIGVLVVIFAFAGIAFAGLTVTGARTSYPAVLTACAWAAYAVILVTAIGTTAVVYLMNDFSGVDASKLFVLNTGMFLSSETAPAARALAGGIDLIAFWAIYLQTVGTAQLSEHATTSQAAGVFIALHILFTGLKAGWAAMFG